MKVLFGYINAELELSAVEVALFLIKLSLINV